MLFHSPAFLLLLLPLYLLVLRGLPPGQLRAWALLVLCYVFYSGTEPIFVLVLFGSSAVDFLMALLLHESRSPRARRTWLVVSIVTNLGLLGFFKYAGWLMPALTPALQALGLPAPSPDFFRSFTLPAGISFYTFQSLSYTIDVYRGLVTPTRSLLDYCNYVAYFPHMIAGPIQRYGHLAPQLRELTHGRPQPQWSAGLDRLLLGVIQKLVIADGCAQITDALAGGLGTPDFGTAWAVALGFGMQIYFDFAAYTHMAIGIALMMGVRLTENFLSPYQSLSIQDFWRRWHVNLSNWFRDYLYFPLGGSRLGHARTVFNILITFLLCGLWHGAGWNFLLWGGLHGLMLSFYRLKQVYLPWFKAPQVVAWALTFIAVHVAWVPFRIADGHKIQEVWAGMAGLHGFGASGVSSVDLLFLGLVAMSAVLLPNAARHWPGRTGWIESSAIASVAMLAVFSATAVNKFIYFQF